MNSGFRRTVGLAFCYGGTVLALVLGWPLKQKNVYRDLHELLVAGE